MLKQAGLRRMTSSTNSLNKKVYLTQEPAFQDTEPTTSVLVKLLRSGVVKINV